MKKRAPSLLLALLALAGLLTAGGCSLGRSPRPDFYMLSSPVENVVQSLSLIHISEPTRRS